MGQISTFYPNPGPSQAEKFCKEEIRMRNLKRALSLTLASVMLLGMMVIGTSAAAGYDDVKETDNVEAIEVLQAVEVMVGDDRGFGPDRPVTRAEMAVVMGKLLNLDYNYYVSTCPFADVSGNYEWARGWVGACAANGIVSGRGDGIYDPGATVTAIEAASMMMRALGYFKYAEDYNDGFVLVTVRQGNQIGIFDGVGSDGSTPMTRNQVAQMALNALRSEMVDFTGTPGIEVNGVKVGYRAEYTSRTSTEKKYNAIEGRTSDVASDANHKGQYYVQLGEELYNGDLRLNNNDRDSFQRPSRTWEYKGEQIGTYMKKELLDKEYTTKVTGRDLYDELSRNTIETYDFVIAVDGEIEPDTLKKGDNAYFTEGNLVRTNTNAVGATDKGVLTQVFVDNNSEDPTVYIAVINTYLAKATKDYDTKKEEATFKVYGVEDIESGSAITLVKNTADKAASTPYTEDLKVRNEDINVEDVKDGDFFLVNVAEGEVKIMTEPEVKSDATITAFKQGSWVNSDGQIDYADTAKYDPEVLDAYNQKNMKDLTYDIFLDKYGYLIGLEQNEDPDQYVFITGRQAGDNDLGDANADMRAIFLDGTVKVIEVNVKDSTITSGGAIANTWCTYTVDKNGIYTLEEVSSKLDAANKIKVAQWAQNANGLTPAEYTIDKGHVSLKASSDGAAADTRVYGNDDTVYLGVSLRTIANASEATMNTTTAANNTGANKDNMSTKWWSTKNTSTTKYAAIIDDVDSVTVGVKNVSLKAKDVLHADVVDNVAVTTDVIIPVHEVYTLYKDNGYVIAAVVIGEDEGTNTNYAYITGSSYNSEGYSSANDEWTWSKEAVVDGKIVDLTEKGSTIKHLNKMTQGNWYEVRYDADGNVRGIKAQAAPNNGTNGAITFVNNAGNKYPNTVANLEAAFDANDTVLMQVNYNATKGLLTYKNGTLYTNKAQTQGFSVSPDVKTVVSLSKLNASNTAVPFDNIEDGYDGYSGLENAIDDLDDNFKGYLNVLFKNDVATVIILDDRTGTKVDEGTDPTPTGSYSSAVDGTLAAQIAGDPLNLAKAKVDDTNTLILPAHYGQNVKQQLRDALTYLGYKVTGEKYDSTSKIWTFATEKDGVTSEVTCNVTKNTGNIGANADEYALVDLDDTKSYVAVGGTVTVTAPATNPGTGYIAKETGDADFDYKAAYATAYTVVTGKDAKLKSGYVSVATPTVTGGGSTKVAAANVSLTVPTYAKDGEAFTVTMKVTADAAVTAATTVAWTVTGGTATGNPTTIAITEGANGTTFTFTITNTAETNVTVVTAALS